MIKNYRSIRDIIGPLMTIDHVEGIKYDELVEVQLQNGTVRRGQVLEVNGAQALVQIFEGTGGVNLRDSKVRFMGHPFMLDVRSEERRGGTDCTYRGSPVN